MDLWSEALQSSCVYSFIWAIWGILYGAARAAFSIDSITFSLFAHFPFQSSHIVLVHTYYVRTYRAITAAALDGSIDTYVRTFCVFVVLARGLLLQSRSLLYMPLRQQLRIEPISYEYSNVRTCVHAAVSTDFWCKALSSWCISILGNPTICRDNKR